MCNEIKYGNPKERRLRLPRRLGGIQAFPNVQRSKITTVIWENNNIWRGFMKTI
jgi:hypothetical protein